MFDSEVATLCSKENPKTDWLAVDLWTRWDFSTDVDQTLSKSENAAAIFIEQRDKFLSFSTAHKTVMWL